MQHGDPRPPQRAGDADREDAAAALRDAGADGRLDYEELEARLEALYAARTHPEIDALLADLRGPRGLAAQRRGGPPGGTAGARAASVTRGDPGAPVGPKVSATVAIMGGARRLGPWRPAARTRVLTIMGGSSIDFTEAQLSHQITRVRVLTVMGSTRIEVSDDVHLNVSKLALMGSNEIEAPAHAIPGAPELNIRLISIMGGAKLRVRARRPPSS